MGITIQNLDENAYEIRRFLNGYGMFPYLIIKTDFKAFIQIPIHFSEQNDALPGIQVNGFTPAELEEYKTTFQGRVHEHLLTVAQKTKASIESNRNSSCELCLVEGPQIGYYFIGETIALHTSIPSGGTLITQEHHLLAMHVQHYLD